MIPTMDETTILITGRADTILPDDDTADMIFQKTTRKPSNTILTAYPSRLVAPLARLVTEIVFSVVVR